MKKRTMETSLAEHSPKLVRSIERRLFLRQGLSLGALAMLSGCNLTDDESVQKVLEGMSRWNDRAQGWLFSQTKLAPEFPESAITKPFPFNGYYPEEAAPDIDEDRYKLIVDGLVASKQPWTLDQLYALPQETQITRLICVEGWSAIGKWTGAPLKDFLARVGAELTAKYVHFACAEGYSVSIDMPTALHPQTQMTFKFDGEILPTRLGFPMRIRIPTKLGFKNPKFVVGLAVLNNYTGGYWEDQGYNWFSGL